MSRLLLSYLICLYYCPIFPFLPVPPHYISSLAFLLLLSLGCLLPPYFLSQAFLFYFFHFSVLLSFLFWYLCNSRKWFSVSSILLTLPDLSRVWQITYTRFPQGRIGFPPSATGIGYYLCYKYILRRPSGMNLEVSFCV